MSIISMSIISNSYYYYFYYYYYCYYYYYYYYYYCYYYSILSSLLSAADPARQKLATDAVSHDFYRKFTRLAETETRLANKLLL